jgi:hypothetical protein
MTSLVSGWKEKDGFPLPDQVEDRFRGNDKCGKCVMSVRKYLLESVI